MSLDKEYIRFMGKAFSAAMRYGGSLEGDGADSFVQDLYSEWKSTSQSLATAESWLNKRLDGVFKSLNEKPEWVEEEPLWPFLDGKPMVFLSQCSMPENELSYKELSPGETVYLFGGRQVKEGKTRMVYVTVSQYAQGF